MDCVWRGGSTPLWLPVRHNVRLRFCNHTGEAPHTGLVKLTVSVPWFYWPSNSRRQMFPAPRWKWGTPGCSRSWQHFPAAVVPVINENVTDDVSSLRQVTQLSLVSYYHILISGKLNREGIQVLIYCLFLYIYELSLTWLQSCHCLQHVQLVG